MTPPTMLQHALDLARHGWRVLPLHWPVGDGCSCGAPCGTPGKHPRSVHGVKDATTDEDQIRRWWSDSPRANIGIATGDGRIAIDIDPRHDGNATWTRVCREHPPLPATLRTRTGGGGRHIFFATPNGTRVRSRSNAIKPGVDTRGDGGYVVAPPSLHVSGGTYDWADYGAPIAPCPDWLLEILEPPPPARSTPPRPPTNRPPPRGYAEAAILGECDRVRGAAEGERNDSLNRAAYSLGQLVAGGVLDDGTVRHELAAAARAAGLGEVESSKTISSGLAAGAQEPRGVPERESPARPAPVNAESPDWEERVIVGRGGRALSTVANVLLVLNHHPAWSGLAARDTFASRDNWRRRPPWHADDVPAEWSDEIMESDAVRLQNWLLRELGWRVASSTCWDALVVAAAHSAYHPVRDYLDGLKWDGTKRLDIFAASYLGADYEDRHALTACRRWLIAACKRIRSPGCQCDSVLVLEGSQGIGKSSALRTLATTTRWFADDIGDVGSKDAADGLRGKWIIEIGELKWRKSDEETKKAFVSRPQDHFRPAYARRPIDVPRQCVLAASTNDSTWQQDTTGARRWWAVRCGVIDLPALARDRDQIWAEADELCRAGEQWWMSDEESWHHRRALEERRTTHPWEDDINLYLDGVGLLDTTSVPEILGRALKKDIGTWTQADSRIVTGILRSAGWEPTGRQMGSGRNRVRTWRRSLAGGDAQGCTDSKSYCAQKMQ